VALKVIDEGDPTLKVTVVDLVMVPEVALTVTLPAVVDEVKVVVAIPLVVVVEVGLIVPPEELKVTIVPSATLFPFTSFTMAIMVEVEMPSAGMVLGLA